MDITENGQARKEEVFRRAEEIFKEQALKWLNSSIPSLGGQVPMEIIDTPEGVELILTVMGRIEHGVLI